jgi:hypothetical protein
MNVIFNEAGEFFLKCARTDFECQQDLERLCTILVNLLKHGNTNFKILFYSREVSYLMPFSSSKQDCDANCPAGVAGQQSSVSQSCSQ